MQPRIGFSLQSSYDLPIRDVLPLLKQAGFSAVSPVWTGRTDLENITACAARNGLILQSLHATTKGIPHLWQPDATAGLDSVFRSIDACAQFRIPILVIHGWQGVRYSFPDQPLYFKNFDRLVAYANRNGISIAFENLEGEEYLAALLARYHGQGHVGFCWDSGHDQCYPHRTDFLQAYGDRLIMTHLNDNCGIRDLAGIPTTLDDLHYLPGDGNLDWTHTICRLQQARRQEILNFEIKTRTRAEADCLYDRLSLKKFIQKAGLCARQIAERYKTAP